MAVARMEPARVRRYNPDALRGKPMERRVRVPHRALVVSAILAGAMLQHILATTPAEPQPAPLAVPALAASAPAPPPAHPATRTALHTASAPKAPPVVVHHATPAAHVAALHLTRNKATAPVSTRQSPLLPPVGAAGDAARVALAPNPRGTILHVPSVSVDAIRHTLSDAGSPALDATYADHKDAAEYIWDAGRVLGVDPAALMGIFMQESYFGTRGVARLTNSVGNIRPLAGQPSLEGYRLYGSWQEGIDDCYRLLRQYAHGGAATISLAIPVWAPPADNNDDGSYVAGVLNAMGALYNASAKA